jgi:hypothetical protein
MYLKDAVYDALDCMDIEMKNPKNYGRFQWSGNGKTLTLYGVQFNCKMNFLNSLLHFNVKICIFNDKKMSDFVRNTLGNLHDIYYNGDRREIVVNVPLYDPDFKYFSDTISAYELSSFPSSIAHEMMHAYQHKKRIDAQKDANKTVHVDNYKNRQLYSVSQHLMTMPFEDAQIMGYALYYATPVEISAFIQQLFTDVLYSNSYQSAIDILDGSTYVENMDKLSTTIELLKGNRFEKGFIEYVEQLTNHPREWLIKYLEDGHKRMLKGYGRIKTIIKDVWLNNKTGK